MSSTKLGLNRDILEFTMAATEITEFCQACD